MKNFLTKIFGTKNDREIKKYYEIVNQINALEDQMKTLDDASLQAQSQKLSEMLGNGATLNDIRIEAFATAREASKRVLGMRHFDVQMIGGLVLHEGKIAEMKTGEGKTLTATLPLYLNALAGKGCHLVTVNDYLAKRDAEWMGQLYRFLGLSVGLIVHGLSDSERREAYGSSITYGTNNEYGFDYLRDNMKTEASRLVQRDPFFAIVDEVDSILIDEARTPLIISGPTETNVEIYYKVASTIPGLIKDSDYTLDEKGNTVSLTEDGINKIEKRLKIENMYNPTNIEYLHHVQQALKAHILFKKDVDYVIRDQKVVIVDEHTGRLMPGRRYSDGLHGALEAKEFLKVESENQTLATITFQNFFRMYEKLAGMTGTADTEAVEFKKIYNLDVVVIPTNRIMSRKDREDMIYLSVKEKFNVIADEIAEKQKKGQPVLVGTVSVEKSELLSSLLKQRHIPHEILNAKNHSREAQIIASAGAKGNVTISTNMAGRGTDIVLGEGVKDVGGLLVIGTERHESRRIDNQLRGRSGRQGDPGESIFYLSLEDDLMRIFASDRLASIMSTLGMKEGEPIVSPMVTRAIERAQKRVEEQNFASRKHLIEYDDVMNQQRQVVYGRRKQILKKETDLSFFEHVTRDLIYSILKKYSSEGLDHVDQDLSACLNEIKKEFDLKEISIDSSLLEKPEIDLLEDEIFEILLKRYREKQESVGVEIFKQIEGYVYMQIIDQAWKDHLLSMDQLRDSVSLRGYAQKDPLQEYKKEGFRLFEQTIARIEEETVFALHRMPPPVLQEQPAPRAKDLDSARLHLTRGEVDPLAASPDDQKPAVDKAAPQAPARRRPQPVNDEPFVRAEEKVGRNDPCPCGSGKKYKKCHGSSDVG